MPTVTPRYGAVFLIWIFSAWTAYVFGLYPWVARLSEPSSTAVNEFVRFFVFGAPVLWAYRSRSAASAGWIGFSEPASGALRTGLVVALAFSLVASSIAVWELHRSFKPALIPVRFWFTGFSVSTVIEELAFRSMLFSAFARWPRYFTVVLSSAAFAAIHFPGWLVSSVHPSGMAWITNTSSIFLLGCVLGIVYLSTRSIWATTFIHAANNLVAALFV